MIYFVQLDSGAIKIGFTQDLDSRMTELKAHYGSDTIVLATIEGDRRTESEMHRRFAHLRFGRLEQFRPATELMDFIGRPLWVSVNPETVEAQPIRQLRLQARVDAETEAKIVELGRIWGPFEPLTPSAVVRRCVELAYRTETAGKAVAGKK